MEVTAKLEYKHPSVFLVGQGSIVTKEINMTHSACSASDKITLRKRVNTKLSTIFFYSAEVAVLNAL